MNLPFSKKAHVLVLLVGWLSVFQPTSLEAQSVTFDAEKLAKFGTKTYTMTAIAPGVRGKPRAEREVGTMVLSVVVEENHIAVSNTTRMNSPDGKQYTEFTAKCRCSKDGQLLFQSAEADVVRNDGEILFESESVVKEGRIIHTFSQGGQKGQDDQEYVEGTVVDLAVFFLVPQLSIKENESVALEHVMTLPTDKIEEPVSHKVTCLGVDSTDQGGGQTLTKFVNTVEGGVDGIQYWVDENGTLTRVLLSRTNRLDLKTE